MAFSGELSNSRTLKIFLSFFLSPLYFRLPSTDHDLLGDEAVDPGGLGDAGALEAPLADLAAGVAPIRDEGGAVHVPASCDAALLPDVEQHAAAAEAREAAAAEHHVEHHLLLLRVALVDGAHNYAFLHSLVLAQVLARAHIGPRYLEQAIAVILPLGRGHEHVQPDLKVVGRQR